MLDNQIPASLYVCPCLSSFPRGPQPGFQDPSCGIFPLCSTHSLEALFDSRYNPVDWMRMSVSSTSVNHGFLISKNFLHSSLSEEKKRACGISRVGFFPPQLPVVGCRSFLTAAPCHVVLLCVLTGMSSSLLLH